RSWLLRLSNDGCGNRGTTAHGAGTRREKEELRRCSFPPWERPRADRGHPERALLAHERPPLATPRTPPERDSRGVRIVEPTAPACRRRRPGGRRGASRVCRVGVRRYLLVR